MEIEKKLRKRAEAKKSAELDKWLESSRRLLEQTYGGDPKIQKTAFEHDSLSVMDVLTVVIKHVKKGIFLRAGDEEIAAFIKKFDSMQDQIDEIHESFGE